MKHDNYSSYILSNLLEDYYKYALLISTNEDTSSYDRKNIGLLHSHGHTSILLVIKLAYNIMMGDHQRPP